ncbi:MAG: cupredoxin domain-containing protein [Chloroflexi bacterium]|nr:cupredoxin domain-containing protein [Chloroflexota bacterium]
MRIDLTKLPFGELMLAILAAAVAVTFITAFNMTVDGGGEGAVASPTPGPPTGGVQATIKMVPTLKFDTNELTIAADKDVTVEADNQDTGTPHNFAVYTDESAAEQLGATEICSAPCTDTVTLNLAPGDYFFRCDVHPTVMLGTVTAAP